MWGGARSISSFLTKPRKSAISLEAPPYSKGAPRHALIPEDRTLANTVYDRWAQSIDSFEQSVQVSAFSSKFDAFLAGKYKLTPDEMAGYKLFDGKGNCNSCHLDGRGTALKAGQSDSSSTAR